MYYSCGEGDVGHSLRVAVADSPVGPYVDQGVDLTPDERFAIDPHPFQDADGSWYLFYARDVLEGERVGTMLAVDRLETMTQLAGQARTILTPSGDWQIFLRDREMYGQHLRLAHPRGPVRAAPRRPLLVLLLRRVVAGADVRRRRRGRRRAAGPVDRPRRRLDHGHGPRPRHRPRATTASSPARTGGDVIVYHAWDAAQTARRMCVDPLVWGPDGPAVDGPTYEPADLDRPV